jgi:hypothetical protein
VYNNLTAEVTSAFSFLLPSKVLSNKGPRNAPPPTQKHSLPPLSPNPSPLPRKPSTIQRPPSPALTTSPLAPRLPQGPQHHISTGTKHTSTPSSPVPPHASDAGDGSLRLASALPRNSGSAKGQAKVSSACEVAGSQEGIVFCTPCHCVWWFDRGDVKGHDGSRTTTSPFPIGRPSKICLRVKVDAGGVKLLEESWGGCVS